MDLYTLESYTGTYNRSELIDDYESLIWTERFIEAGDTRIVLPATSANVALVAPGTLVGVSTSRELMLLDNRSIEDGAITVTGKTLEAFFEQRYIERLAIWETPENIMKTIVLNMQDRNNGLYQIPGLTTVLDEASGGQVWRKFPTQSAYTGLLDMAKAFQIGMGVYWTVNEVTEGYDLIFETRGGRDMTRKILFSPELDNLADIKELFSETDSKTDVTVYPPTSLAEPDKLAEYMGPVSASNFQNSINPFKRRMMYMTLEDVNEDDLDGATREEKQDSLRDLMQDKAWEVLKSKKRVRMVDGEITPESQYSYYTQYNPLGEMEYQLGDSVKIAGNFTTPITGMITEYIQSSDPTGARSYPTVVVPADSPASSPT